MPLSGSDPLALEWERGAAGAPSRPAEKRDRPSGQEGSLPGPRHLREAQLALDPFVACPLCGIGVHVHAAGHACRSNRTPAIAGSPGELPTDEESDEVTIEASTPLACEGYREESGASDDRFPVVVASGLGPESRRFALRGRGA